MSADSSSPPLKCGADWFARPYRPCSPPRRFSFATFSFVSDIELIMDDVSKWLH